MTPFQSGAVARVRALLRDPRWQARLGSVVESVADGVVTLAVPGAATRIGPSWFAYRTSALLVHGYEPWPGALLLPRRDFGGPRPEDVAWQLVAADGRVLPPGYVAAGLAVPPNHVALAQHVVAAVLGVDRPVAPPASVVFPRG